ncbi:MAG: family transcriptional regulator [Propionibacteriaceae bacterium]|nr:family transcriptional regulator [Propionibacteriaceae bacterium]
MQVRLLGSVDVVVDGAPRSLPGLRRKAVLAVLALDAGSVVSSQRLIDLVWGEAPPATAVNTLQAHVSQLRHVLGSKTAIRARPSGYLLDLGDEATDVAVAKQLIGSAALTSDPVRRAGHLRAALALWRGSPLADVAGIAWLDEQAQHLKQLWLQATENLVEIRLAQGEHAALVPELERLTRDYPFNEHLHGQLMLALYRAGRQADALAVYRRLRQTLADELGIDPSPPLREMEAAVLRQDLALDPSTRWAAAVPPAAAAPVPAQLPQTVPGFAGRAAELVELDALLPAAENGDSGRPSGLVIAALSGTAGIGKTTLAVYWAHRVARHFPDGQLYVNLRGFDAADSYVNPMDALRGFLQAFGTPAGRIPPDLDGAAALYRSVLAGKRLLVVLDNARNVDQIRPLLPGAPGCMAIVTSREQLMPLVAAEGAHPLALGLLAAAEARDLLTHRLGTGRVSREPDAVEEIIARCARLPLGLGIAASHAAVRPTFSLAVLAARLRDAAGGLDAFQGGDPATDVRVVFSWSYRALSADAARLFRLLGLHPGPDIDAPAVASLSGLPPSRAQTPLAELVQAHLLTEHTPGRYTFHDLLRAYAAERAASEEQVGDTQAALCRVFDHYLYAAHAAVVVLDPTRPPIPLDDPQPGVTRHRPGDHDQALAWFAAEHPVLLAVIGRAVAGGFDRWTWKLAWTMTTYFDWSGRWDNLIETQEAGLDALRRLGDKRGQAHAHRDIGRTLAQLGRYDFARSHLDRAVDLYGELGDEAGQARAHHNLGWMWQAQGRSRHALAESEEALRLFQQVGDQVGQARSLNGSGWIHAQLGDYTRSVSCCEQAVALMHQLGDRHGEAGAWDSVAFARHHLGAYRSAIDGYERALTGYRALGDRLSQAAVLIHLGDTQDATGEVNSARDAWQEALRIFEDLGQPDAAEARMRLERTEPVPTTARSD